MPIMCCWVPKFMIDRTYGFFIQIIPPLWRVRGGVVRTVYGVVEQAQLLYRIVRQRSAFRRPRTKIRTACGWRNVCELFHNIYWADISWLAWTVWLQNSSPYLTDLTADANEQNAKERYTHKCAHVCCDIRYERLQVRSPRERRLKENLR